MTITFTAYTDSLNNDAPLMVRIEGEFTAEFANKFPKSFGFHKAIGKNYGFTWNLKANEVTGEKNEAALKRLARLLDTVPEHYGCPHNARNAMTFEQARSLVE